MMRIFWIFLLIFISTSLLSQENQTEQQKSILQRLEWLEEWVKDPPQISYGLIGCYPFNGNAKNESRNQADGIIHGATLSEDRYGSFNASYSFNGQSYIDLGNFFDQAFNSHSYSLWIKPFSTNGEQFIISKGEGGVSGINITLVNGCIRADYGDLPYTSDIFFISKPLIIKSNVWYHIAVIVDRNNSLLTFYLNGKKQSVDILVRNILVRKNNIEVKEKFAKSIDLRNNKNFLVGSIYGYGEYRGFFHGVIDDIHIYNRIISENEVQILAK